MAAPPSSLSLEMESISMKAVHRLSGERSKSSLHLRDIKINHAELENNFFRVPFCFSLEQVTYLLMSCMLNEKALLRFCGTRRMLVFTV